MSTEYRVLHRCPHCRAMLVIERETCVIALFGDIRIFKDTGKVTGQCRKCQKNVTLEEAKTPKTASPEMASLQVLLTGL